MHKLLFLSDLHICAPGETIIGLDPIAKLQEALDAALGAHGDAEALILLGDLTHNGRPEEYTALRAILDEVPIPVIPMLGNHDRREAFLAAFPSVPQMQTGHVQQAFDIGNHRIITLDSLDGPPYPAGHHGGRLCLARMGFLEEALASRHGKRAIVCIHHPPFETGILGMDMIKLKEGDAFLDLLAQHGNLHLICGHVHRTMSGSARGVPWSMFKSPCHQGLLDLTSPNSHLSSNEPGAFGLMLLTDDGAVVHSEDVALPNRRVYGGYATKD